MDSDPKAISSHTTPIESTADTMTTRPNQTSFASLPREIRDKIYRLALPHSRAVRLIIGWDFRSLYYTDRYSILSPRASATAFANEAWEMLLKNNRLHIDDCNLPVVLGEDGIHFIHHLILNRIHVGPKGPFHLKPWLRDMVIHVNVEGELDELAGRIGLLFECPALRQVKVILIGYRTSIKRKIWAIHSAFKALAAELLGHHLVFSLIAGFYDASIPDEGYWRGRRFIGDLEQLEILEYSDSDNESEYSEVVHSDSTD